MLRIYVGALMAIGGIAAFIEAHSNVPIAAVPPSKPSRLDTLQALRTRAPEYFPGEPAKGLSPDLYDLVRIAGWALLILGILTAVLGLLEYLQGLLRKSQAA
jgi:hypothetical protein